eukprot:TRINITY_DN2750_c0_g1_i3.p1 TRINITY_DN2750_c0_g1~~TRINITY_DN2750_c0_g1_i3.p1  ORF type:complete len:371 (-),score=120.59 TRINITY_DN2750_c0_g1_i3:947-1984(-)
MLTTIRILPHALCMALVLFLALEAAAAPLSPELDLGGAREKHLSSLDPEWAHEAAGAAKAASEWAAEYNMTQVVKRKGWVENLWWCGDRLFFSELNEGRIWNTSAPHFPAPDLYIGSGLKRVLGVVCPRDRPDVLYGVGTTDDGAHVVYESTEPGTFTVLVETQTLGNGLGLHEHTGLLYTASEGNFLPGTGVVYRVDPKYRNVVVVGEGLWAADGLFIDQERHLLYVGQLPLANLWVYDLSAQRAIGFIDGLQGFTALLDDFTLASRGTAVLGCDWSGNKVVEFAALNSTVPTRDLLPAAAGIRRPTSARFGPDRLLYVSEGRLPQSTPYSGIWQINVTQLLHS